MSTRWRLCTDDLGRGRAQAVACERIGEDGRIDVARNVAIDPAIAVGRPRDDVRDSLALDGTGRTLDPLLTCSFT